MAWSDGLDQETRWELFALHLGLTLREIGIAAVRHPKYAAMFERLGASVWTYTGDEHMDRLPSSPVIGAHLAANEPPHVDYPTEHHAEVQALIVVAARDAAEKPTADAREESVQPPGGRPLGELEIAAVEKTEARLKARRKTTRRGERAKDKSLTYEAIAMHAGFVNEDGRPNRDVVAKIEELIELGWDLRKSPPGFSAKPGCVKLPSPREAARLLRSR
jgi:hypothetical protein